jgi:putative addiction module antidote
MTHPLKVRQVGSSLGVILPKEVANGLDVKKGDTIYLTAGPEGFRVVAHDPDFAKVMESYRKIAKRYRNTLRELAK